jgi:hypothetical protein
LEKPIGPIVKVQAESRYQLGTLFIQEVVWVVIGSKAVRIEHLLVLEYYE